jgi:hypothetical protein
MIHDSTIHPGMIPAGLVAGIDDRFGLCPQCVEAGDFEEHFPYVNVRSNHWKICDKHQMCWCWGANVLSGWKNETEEHWRRSAALLEPMTEVKPYYLPEGTGGDLERHYSRALDFRDLFNELGEAKQNIVMALMRSLSGMEEDTVGMSAADLDQPRDP